MTTAFQADAFQFDPLAFQIDDGAAPAAPGVNPSTGSGRGTGRKSLPYGWWNESAAPEQELKTAERAIKAAQAEVRADKAIQPATVDRLRSALWFAQADAQILRLEQIAQAEQIKALQALARKVQIEKARLAAELEDEEEIELLLLSSL